MIGSAKMFRISLNTHLLESNKEVFTLSMLDPDKVQRDPRFPKIFSVTLYFDHHATSAEDEEHTAQVYGSARMENQIVALRKERKIDPSIILFTDKNFDTIPETLIEHGNKTT